MTINEPFFQGHFPDYPVMPGVLVIEALAQVAGPADDAVRRRAGATAASSCFFAGIDNARFKRQVVPGDQLMLEVDLVRAVRGVGKFARARDGRRRDRLRGRAARRDARHAARATSADCSMPRIHPTALVDPARELADDVEVGAYSIVGAARAHRRGHASSARTWW